MNKSGDNMESPHISWTEFQPGAWAVDNLLTPEDCQCLLERAREEGIETKKMECDTRHRQRVTVRLSVPEISEILWERIRDQIPQELVITGDEEIDPPGLLAPQDCIGRWTPSRVHSNMNVAYCTGKGHLAAHRDGDSILSENERSFLTINGYLTDRPVGTGGATRFLKDDIVVSGADIHVSEETDVLYRIESDKAGKAVVFLHGLMHDGESLAPDSPPKWVFRSLVYYTRDPSSAPQLTPEQQEARACLKQAEQYEMNGDISNAIKFYNKAYRLDPSLES